MTLSLIHIFIAQKAFDEKAGARSIAKCIRREVEDPVSELIVQQFAAPPTDIAVTVGEELSLIHI